MLAAVYMLLSGILLSFAQYAGFPALPFSPTGDEFVAEMPVCVVPPLIAALVLPAFSKATSTRQATIGITILVTCTAVGGIISEHASNGSRGGAEAVLFYSPIGLGFLALLGATHVLRVMSSTTDGPNRNTAPSQEVADITDYRVCVCSIVAGLALMINAIVQDLLSSRYASTTVDLRENLTYYGRLLIVLILPALGSGILTLFIRGRRKLLQLAVALLGYAGIVYAIYIFEQAFTESPNRSTVSITYIIAPIHIATVLTLLVVAISLTTVVERRPPQLGQESADLAIRWRWARRYDLTPTVASDHDP